MTTLPRRLLATAATVVVAGAALLAAPSPASAATGSITCVGTTQITFDPGLTYHPQPVHATESTHLSPCASTVPGITSGTNFQEYTADWSCLTPLHTSSATYPFHWNDGTSSTISINYTVTSVGLLVISEVHGSVVDGVLTGATVSGTWTYAQPNQLECLSPQGMKEQFGAVFLTITSV